MGMSFPAAEAFMNKGSTVVRDFSFILFTLGYAIFNTQDAANHFLKQKTLLKSFKQGF